MKDVIGDLICPTVAGDDAHTMYGRCMVVALHAVVPGDGLESVPFLLNSVAPLWVYFPYRSPDYFRLHALLG